MKINLQKSIYTIITVSLLHSFSFTQEVDEACGEPNKKAAKQLEMALKTQDPRAKSDFFAEAMKLDNENATSFYEFGLFAYNEAMKTLNSGMNTNTGQRQLTKAREIFMQADERCDNFHGDIPYYIGVIFYYEKNMEAAMPYFDRFLVYKNSDLKRYPENFQKKKTDVLEVIQKYKDEKELLENKVPFNPKIVINVSSPNDEYFPMLSPDNELMFYTRKLDRRGLGELTSKIVEEFTFSERNSVNDIFSNGTTLPFPFNDGTFQSYGASTVSVDNKEMIICACKEELYSGQKYKNCDLYITYFEQISDGVKGIRWTPLQNMGEGINTKNGWEGQPTLSADGNTLYYTAIRPSTQQDDIFVSRRDNNGKWGVGVPFTEINTPGKDKSPFLHQDSETLYFVSSSSDTRKGVGGLDIFYTRNENGKWSKPKNIGYPINSENDEIGIFVSADATQAYFSSNEKGDWNIYSFELYEEARPKPVVIVKGQLNDTEGNPIKDAIVEVAYSDSNEKQTFRVNGVDGKYAAVVKADKVQDVLITVKKEEYAFESKLIEKKELDAKRTINTSTLTVSKVEKGKAYTINDILYETSSAEISKRSAFILNQFVDFLKLNPTVKITIQGHTDDLGDDQKNMTLSTQRADEVKKYLISKGIEENRLSSQGFGETKPKVPNINATNRAINRRTDFQINDL